MSVNRAIIRNGFEGGTDVLDEDPLFVLSPWNNPTGYGDLRLQVGSPAINFGLTEFLPPDTNDLDGDGDTTEPIPIDLAGEPRIQGAEVDLGAYEGPISVSNEPGAVSAPDHLSVYPNPATTIASVSLSLATGRSNVRVEVLDLLGRRVMVLHDGPSPAGTTTLELDARSLPAGLYLVRVIGDDVRLPATMITIVR